jgi:hypothetical protein
MCKRVTYLDSGILIAASQGEHQFFERAFAILDDPDRDFISSDFVQLEVLPKPSFFNRVTERDFLNDLFSGSINIVPTTPSKMGAALVLACALGLSAVDAIHLQTAVDEGVDEFVTTERSTSPYFRLHNPAFTLTSIIP